MPQLLNIDFDQPLTQEELMLEESSPAAETLAAEAKAKADELAAQALKNNSKKPDSKTEELAAEEETDNNSPTLEELMAENPDEIVNNSDNTSKNSTLKNTPVQETQKAEALKAVANYLKTEGVLPSVDLEKFTGTPEDLIQAMQNEMTEGIEEYKNQRHPLVKRLMEADEAGIPVEQLLDIKAQEVKYNAITEDNLKENPGLQKELYKAYLKETTKFSDAKINKMLTTAEDDFTLESIVSEEALPELKRLQEQKEQELTRITKAQQEAARVQNEKLLNDYKLMVDKTDEIFPGIKVSKNEKAEIFKMSTTPIANDGYGNPVLFAEAVYKKDPLKYNLILNYILNKTKGFEDLSAFMTTAKTAAAKELEKNITNSTLKKVTPFASNAVEEEEDALAVLYRNFPSFNPKNK